MKTILSIYDYTGVMVKPWLNAGYRAIICDIQHKTGFHKSDDHENLFRFGGDLRFGIPQELRDNLGEVVFVAGFPPCTNTAVSGAAHFLKKGPRALAQALDLFATVKELADEIVCPYFIENPISTLSTYCGEPDYIFNPWEYGGYLPEDDVHPFYPEYILPRDAYPKSTCLWVGNGFVLPPKKPVFVKPGYSEQFYKLGGKSIKTKNIRSATPRGFSQAVFEYNNPDRKTIEDYLQNQPMTLFSK